MVLKRLWYQVNGMQIPDVPDKRLSASSLESEAVVIRLCPTCPDAVAHWFGYVC